MAPVDRDERRARYATDADHRSARISHASKKRLHDDLQSADDLKIDAMMGNTPVYSDEKLAKCLNRTRKTVMLWSSNRFIPDTPYKDRNGRRFYTLSMIKTVVSAIGGVRRVRKDPNVYAEIESGWREAGVL